MKTNKLYRFLTQSLSSRRHDFMRISLALAAVLWLGALSVWAEYFYVREPGTCTNTILQSPFTNWDIAATNIQWAVDVATNSGDIVLVSNGVYTTTTPTFAGNTNNIVVLTNRITLKSVNGPSVTVIDGNSPALASRVVCISSNATLDGFTVRNGKHSDTRGGGILIGWCPLGGTVTNCIVCGNAAYGGCGGGILIWGTIGIIANCTIYSNVCPYNGGGIAADWASSGSMINNCVFWGNSTYSSTVGIQGGGGLSILSSYMSVKNCLFYRNHTKRYGGGIVKDDNDRSLVLENCTIVTNTSSANGGGIYIGALANWVVRNLVIYDNSAVINYADAFTTNLNILTNSCIRDTNGVPNWNTSGNITNHPQFVDAANNNYRLRADSPCINTGINQNWMTNAYDLDGRSRIRYGTVDIGAYELIYEGTIFIIP